MALLLSSSAQCLMTYTIHSDGDMVMTLPTSMVVPEVVVQQPIKVQLLELFEETRGKVKVFIM